MPQSPSTGATAVLVGSYTPDSDGDGPGITALRLDPTTGCVTYDDEVNMIAVAAVASAATPGTTTCAEASQITICSCRG